MFASSIQSPADTCHINGRKTCEDPKMAGSRDAVTVTPREAAVHPEVHHDMSVSVRCPLRSLTPCAKHNSSSSHIKQNHRVVFLYGQKPKALDHALERDW